MMGMIFVDAGYWIALFDRRDQHNENVRSAERSLGRSTLVTTHEVLTEFIAAFTRQPPRLRKAVAARVEDILLDPNIRVVSQSAQGFSNGFDLFKQRVDKDYSLQDCISMNVMRELGIDEVLSTDKCFTQEGFTNLIPLE